MFNYNELQNEKMTAVLDKKEKFVKFDNEEIENKDFTMLLKNYWLFVITTVIFCVLGVLAIILGKNEFMISLGLVCFALSVPLAMLAQYAVNKLFDKIKNAFRR